MNRTTFLFLGLLLISCTKSYEPIEYGKDVCADCKMTIMDSRFGAECILEKGKVYKFDDLLCLKNFSAAHKKKEKENGIELIFVEDYLRSSTLPLHAESACYLKHEFFGSPMNGHYAAFADEEKAGHLCDSLGLQIMHWNEIQ